MLKIKINPWSKGEISKLNWSTLKQSTIVFNQSRRIRITNLRIISLIEEKEYGLNMLIIGSNWRIEYD